MRTRNEMEMKYIWVLDYTNGRIYRYEITSNWNHGEWNPDSESIEDFLINQNHQIKFSYLPQN